MQRLSDPEEAKDPASTVALALPVDWSMEAPQPPSLHPDLIYFSLKLPTLVSLGIALNQQTGRNPSRGFS